VFPNGRNEARERSLAPSNDWSWINANRIPELHPNRAFLDLFQDRPFFRANVIIHISIFSLVQTFPFF